MEFGQYNSIDISAFMKHALGFIMITLGQSLHYVSHAKDNTFNCKVPIPCLGFSLVLKGERMVILHFLQYLRLSRYSLIQSLTKPDAVLHVILLDLTVQGSVM